MNNPGGDCYWLGGSFKVYPKRKWNSEDFFAEHVVVAGRKMLFESFVFCKPPTCPLKILNYSSSMTDIPSFCETSLCRCHWGLNDLHSLSDVSRRSKRKKNIYIYSCWFQPIWKVLYIVKLDHLVQAKRFRVSFLGGGRSGRPLRSRRVSSIQHICNTLGRACNTRPCLHVPSSEFCNCSPSFLPQVVHLHVWYIAMFKFTVV